MLQMTNEINTKIQKFNKCGSVNNHIKKLLLVKLTLNVKWSCVFAWFVDFYISIFLVMILLNKKIGGMPGTCNSSRVTQVIKVWKSLA